MSLLTLFQPKHQVMALMETETEIREERLTVKAGHLPKDKTLEAWGLIPSCLARKKGSNRAYELLCASDATPFDFQANEPFCLECHATAIARSAFAPERFNAINQSGKDKRYEFLKILVLVAGIAFVLLAGFIAYQNGTIDFSKVKDAWMKLGGARTAATLPLLGLLWQRRVKPNALVWDLTGDVVTFAKERVDGASGRLRVYDGDNLHLMRRVRNEKNEVVVEPLGPWGEVHMTPAEFYPALVWHADVVVVYGIAPTMWEKLNTMLMIGLVFGLFAFIWLLIMSAGGK